jgi:hypothetical protein
MPSRNGRIDTSIWGISDTELLAIVDDLSNEDGWTENMDVRLQLGENVEAKDVRSGVGSRLAWMRRYGWLERNPDSRTQHRLSEVGRVLLANPRLTKAVESALVNMNPAQRLALTRELAEGGQDIRTALRRQWTRSLR